VFCKLRLGVTIMTGVAVKSEINLDLAKIRYHDTWSLLG
jgi:hypothetical protein